MVASISVVVIPQPTTPLVHTQVVIVSQVVVQTSPSQNATFDAPYEVLVQRTPSAGNNVTREVSVPQRVTPMLMLRSVPMQVRAPVLALEVM